jgi:hypothetical protein
MEVNYRLKHDLSVMPSTLSFLEFSARTVAAKVKMQQLHTVKFITYFTQMLPIVMDTLSISSIQILAQSFDVFLIYEKLQAVHFL